MLKAEFDKFAQDYQDDHAASIRLSGETPEFFAAYKIRDVAARLARRGIKPARILDFGSGVGNSLSHMRAAFPESDIVLLDPSEQSLEIAAKRFPGQAHFQPFDGRQIPYENGHFDLIFAACVFHHIPDDMHVELMQEIRRVLKASGSFFVFEHNPFNPLTLHAVRNCRFDENAVLIKASTMNARLARAGFIQNETVYRMFFPRVLAGLRSMEKYLGRLPLGGQYFVHAINAPN